MKGCSLDSDKGGVDSYILTGSVGSDIVEGCSLDSDRGGVNSYVLTSIWQAFLLGGGRSQWILGDLVVERPPHTQCEW